MALVSSNFYIKEKNDEMKGVKYPKEPAQRQYKQLKV